MRARDLFSLLLLILAPAKGLAQPRVELVTFGPGDQLAECFGHSALRVHGDEVDVLYNLGQPRVDSAMLPFHVVRGDAEFTGISGGGAAELRRYEERDREVRAQVLKLPATRVRWLASALEQSVRSGDSRYRYEPFDRNCTTEVRDWIDRASDGRLRAWTRGRAARETFRETTLANASGELALLFGADLFLGPTQDVVPSLWDSLHLPRALHDAVASVPNLADESQRIYARRTTRARHDPYIARYFVVTVGVLAFLFALLSRATPRLARVSGAVLFIAIFAMGQAGLAIAILTAGSQLADVAWNENLIAMWPTDLLLLGLAAMQLRGRRVVLGRLGRGYLLIRALGIALLLFAKGIDVSQQDNLVAVFGSGLVLAAVAIAWWPQRADTALRTNV